MGAHESLAVLGQSRSGKTTLVKALLPAIASYVIIDTAKKREDFADPRWGLLTDRPEDICYHPRVVYQVDLHSPKGLRDYDRALDLIYNVRADPAGKPAVTVILDEAKHSAPTVPRPMLARMVFSGMGRGIATWALTQTRFKVYPNLFSDAICVISFRVQSARDRAVLEGDIGVPCQELLTLEDYGFMYWRQGMREWAGPNKFQA